MNANSKDIQQDDSGSNAPTPEAILKTGWAFWSSKVLLTAVAFELFTHLGDHAMTGAQLEAALGLHPRATWDFLDALVALGFLDRDGEGRGARYRNTPEAALFLDKRKPTYVGGILEMFNSRLYRYWGDLDEALRTGKPQNEIKETGESMFAALYRDPKGLEGFMNAMTGISMTNFKALAETFDFSRYQTLCDVGGATGQLSLFVAKAHPHLRCTSFDLPPVAPIARENIDAHGLGDRIAVASGDFFKDPLPKAEFGDAFDYTGADFRGWCEAVGFSRFEVLPLVGPASAAIAYK